MNSASWRGMSGDLRGHAAVIAEQLRRNGFDPADAVNRQVLGLAEEAGEFVGAYRRWSGQARRTGTADDMYEELADVIITAFVTAHELDVDIDTVISNKLRKIHTRGWREPTTAEPRQCRCGTYYQVGNVGNYTPEPCPVHDRRRSA